VWRQILVRVTEDDGAALPGGPGPVSDGPGASREDTARWQLVLALGRLEGPAADHALDVLADYDDEAISTAAAAKALAHLVHG